MTTATEATATATAADKGDGVRKAAIFLMTLGQDAAAEILKKLSPDEVRRITAEITKISALPSREVDQVLGEFHQNVTSGAVCAVPGEVFARDMLVNALGQEPARKMMDQVSRLAHMDTEVLEAIQKADSDQLAHVVQREHPQTAAVIVSQLDPAMAGALLSRFRPDVRSSVIRRMAYLDKISPEVLHRIGAALGPSLKALGEFSRKPYGGRKTVADILSSLDGAAADEILNSVAQVDPSLVDDVRRMMVVFEDLVGIDQDGVKALLAALDRKILTMALKGTSEQLREHFTNSMSQRGAEMLREDMEALGPVRLKDVEAAQHQVIALARKLQSEGALSLKPSESDRYVV